MVWITVLMIGLVILPLISPAQAANAAGGDKVRLRVVHAAPGFGNAKGEVDVYINGRKRLSNVSFFSASEYLTLSPGNVKVQVTPAGARPTHGNSAVDKRFPLAGGKDYTIVASGTKATNNVGGTLLEDDNAAPAAGKVKLRVAHFSPNAPGVDIFINGEKAVPNLEFTKTAGYLEVDPGTYKVGIAPANATVIFETDVTLEGNTVYTAWANGLLGNQDALAFKVTPTIDSAFELARVRAVHAVPDIVGKPVDVFVNGNKVVTFDFFDATEYLPLPAGTYDVRVAFANEGPEKAVIKANVPVEGGKDYSIVARGSVGGNNLGAAVLVDDNAAPAFGKTKLRVAHFSPDAPGVDIFINGERTIRNLKFLGATGYLEVDPGTYEVGIAPTGRSVIFTTTATLEANKVVTAWANGLLGGQGAQAFKVTPTIDASFEFARVRAVHAVPDIAGKPVDVFVNGNKVVTFDFFDATEYLPLPAGEYDVRVAFANDGPDKAVIQADVTVEAGKDYSIIARGSVAGDNLGAAVLEDNNDAPAAGKTKLRVAHFSPDAPAVDIFVNNTRVITDLSFLEATGYLEVDPGTYEVGVAPAGGSVIFTTTATLAADQVVTAWANGLLNGSGAQAFKVTPTIDAAFEFARVRFLQASPNAPNVDIFFDGEKVFSDIGPAQLTNFVRLPAKTYKVDVKAVGSDETSLSSSLTLEAGESFTVVLFGTFSANAALNNANTAAALEMRAIKDDLKRPSAGKAKVRMLHFAPNVAAVDLRAGERVLFDDVSYADMKGAYTEVDAGLLAASITSADGSQKVLSSNWLFASGGVYTVVALGKPAGAPGDAPVSILSATDVQASNVVYIPTMAR
jgi:predicted ester cyclase